MYYIRKLPLLFALLAAVIAGITGLSRSMTNDKILLHMIIGMVIFYALGFLARHNLMKAYDYVMEKREKEEKEAEAEKQEQDQEGNQPHADETKNIIVDFEPLKVSRAIREELRRSE